MLSGCEVELQELMRQIDLMVQQKKLDWETERQRLQARLDVREQEYHIQKATLEQKHQEVSGVKRCAFCCLCDMWKFKNSKEK